jgi:uncharacterized membrane protein
MSNKSIQIILAVGAFVLSLVAAFFVPSGWVPIVFLTVVLFWGIISIFPEYWNKSSFWLILAGGLVATAMTEGFVIIFAVVKWGNGKRKGKT